MVILNGNDYTVHAQTGVTAKFNLQIIIIL